ncbi:hypothetical protein QOT17_001328 [Balamuthia mandrillaris]
MAASLISVYGGMWSVGPAVPSSSSKSQIGGKEEKGGTAIWNAMMQACTQCGDGQEALQLFQQMQEAGMATDAFTFATVLKTCGMRKDMAMGKSTTMIAVHGLHGQGKADWPHYKRWKNTAWSQMPSPSSTAGGGRLGLLCCHEREKHNIQPTTEHFTCMGDLLGRATSSAAAGRWEEVEKERKVRGDAQLRGEGPQPPSQYRDLPPPGPADPTDEGSERSW